MKEVKVKIKYIHDDVKDLYKKGEPSYVHDGDSGMDVYAYIKDGHQYTDTQARILEQIGVPQEERNRYYVIAPGETVLVKTGFKISIPMGYEVQVRSNSGNSLKKDLVVANSPGTIDSNYRGECGIILHNNKIFNYVYGSRTEDFIVIKHGDKIAQLVLCPVLKCVWDEVDFLDETTRGDGGYGSTEKTPKN